MELTKRVNRRENNGEEGNNHEPSPEFPSLPLEVMTDILLRLPSKSVGRFRCVSKPLCSLLTDPKFAKNHLDLILRNDAVRSGHRRLLLSLNNLFAVNLDMIGINDLTAVELDYPLKEDLNLLSEMRKETVTYRLWGGTEVTYECDPACERRSWVNIVGSSNGLMCISLNEYDVFLYNPTTGDSKRIPDLPESLLSKSIDEENVEIQIHGFGFDVLTDDYKVVKFVASNEGDINANVYSWKTDSWRQIRDLRYRHVSPTPGMLLNGAIHWIAKLEESNERVVAVFDLKTEEFREMSLPDRVKEDCNHMFQNFEVCNFKGCLCVVYSCYEMHDVIWVMNEYGLESSWSKIQINVSYISIEPLYSTKNEEEVLLVIDEHLVLYNFECNTSRNLEIRGVGLGVEFEANTYVESLISPNSYGVKS